MKALLILPPADFAQRRAYTAMPPLGLAYLAASLRKDGIGVRAEDLWFRQPTDLAALLAEYRPDLLGIQVSSHQCLTSRDCAAMAKRILPECRVVFGGCHATALPELILSRWPEVDAVVVGEGEETLTELCGILERGGDPATVAGLALRDASGEALRTPPRPFIEDLDRLPRPDRGWFPLDRYPKHRRYGLYAPRLGVTSSRGCHGRCSFCASGRLWGNRWRTRSDGDVLGELAELAEQYPGEPIRFTEDNFCFDPTRVMEICEGILRRGLTIRWWANSRVDLPAEKPEEMFSIMAQAGCQRLSFGIESAAPEVLEAMHKQSSPEMIELTLRRADEAGLHCHAFLILGCVNENKETIRHTLRVMRRCAVPSVNTTVATIYPGTELADFAAYHPGSLQNNGTYNDEYWLESQTPPNFVGFIREWELDFYMEVLRELELTGLARFAGRRLRRHDTTPARQAAPVLLHGAGLITAGGVLIYGAVAAPVVTAGFLTLLGLTTIVVAGYISRRNHGHLSDSPCFVPRLGWIRLHTWTRRGMNRLAAMSAWLGGLLTSR
ncbi:cobalamin-dependent protein [bacterium]|nr:cobalamin-dependent protein [candidate division CSSED10-310 bacterium]